MWEQSLPAQPRAGKAPVFRSIQLLCNLGALLPASVFLRHGGLQTQLGLGSLHFPWILWVMWAEGFPARGVGMKYVALVAGRVTQSYPLPSISTTALSRDRDSRGYRVSLPTLVPQSLLPHDIQRASFTELAAVDSGYSLVVMGATNILRQVSRPIAHGLK